jgi:hypothetical protein
MGVSPINADGSLKSKARIMSLATLASLSRLSEYIKSMLLKVLVRISLTVFYYRSAVM